MNILTQAYVFGIILHVGYAEIWAVPNGNIEVRESIHKSDRICQKKIYLRGRISKKKCQEYHSYKWMTPTNVDGGISPKNNSMDYPHVVAIGLISQKGLFYLLCAGALISTDYVLSTYSCCTHKLKPTIVKLGTSDVGNNHKTGMKTKIKDIKHYIPKDLSLVKLTDSVTEFSEFIQPACIVEPSEENVQRTKSIVGWYFFKNDEGEHKDKKSHVLQIITESNINKYFSLHVKTSLNQILFFTNYTDVLRPSQTGAILQTYSIDNQNRISYYTIQGIFSNPLQSVMNSHEMPYIAIKPHIDWIESIVWPKNKTLMQNGSLRHSFVRFKAKYT